MYQGYYIPYGMAPMYQAMPSFARAGAGMMNGLGRGIGMPFRALGNGANAMGGIGRGIGGLGALSNARNLGAAASGASRIPGLGLLGRLRGISWGSLFNNASRALGVVNQAIPLVKQAGPMMSNMKQVLRVASIFKDETDPIRSSNNRNIKGNNNINNTTNYNYQAKSTDGINNQTSPSNSLNDSYDKGIDANTTLSYDSDDYSPRFFVS